MVTYQDLIDADFDEAELERRIIQNGETIEQIAEQAKADGYEFD